MRIEEPIVSVSQYIVDVGQDLTSRDHRELSRNGDATRAASELVLRAEQRGETTPKVQQIVDHIIAPLYHHIAFALSIDDDYPNRLVREVLSMAS